MRKNKTNEIPMELFNTEFQKLAKLRHVRTEADYKDGISDFYDALQDGYQEDVAFFLKKTGKKPLTILELGGGTGRITIPLAKAGHTVYTLDNSQSMQRVLISKLDGKLKKRVIPVSAPMTDFRMDARFDYVILGLNTVFYLLKAEDRLSCFNCVRPHLKKNGRFIIDMMLPRVSDLQNIRGKYDFSVLDGPKNTKRLSLTFTKYDRKRQLQVLNFLSIDIKPDGKARFFITPSTEYYPSPGEMKLLLAQCGFQIESFCGDYKGTPFEDDTTKGDLVITARLKNT